MRCERCAFFAEREGLGSELRVCRDYDETDESRRYDREACEVYKDMFRGER